VHTAELEFLAWTNPITTAFGAEVAASDLSGRTVACHRHITAGTICLAGPLLQAGARVRMALCNPDSTDDRTASHLASMGVEIRGHAGMSAVEHADALAWLASEPADAVSDVGGGASVALRDRRRPFDLAKPRPEKPGACSGSPHGHFRE
jgi:adenosylhomocysteinase